ncbi:MAG: tetratricopeptide repeat protein [Actinoplanes sp.]
MWDLRVLGPVELWAVGRQIDLGTAKQRAVLAVLALEPGRTVPVEVLIDRVWDDTAPRTVRNALHTYVLRLRRAFDTLDGDVPALEFRNGGYALRAEPDRIDLSRFQSLLRRPRVSPADTAADLRAALALWRDEPLAGLRGDWVARVRDDLEQQRLSAVLALAPLELELGTAPAAVADLVRALVEAHPLVEPLAALLIRALHADRRPAEAQAVYQRIRQRLRQESGTEPGPELSHAAQATAPTPASHDVNAPRQLPRDVRGFTGRHHELTALHDLLDEADGPVIAVVSGTAGVGKTALAVHWAHEVRGRFPAGQLYVNLRGFDPGGPPATPTEALRGFLGALGVPPKRIPADEAAQAALFRSRVTGRRMLILLDNAADAAQVRPLLPAEPGCLVVVTSRSPLAGLVATEGAQPLRLETLPADEARDLLIRRLGEQRIKDEPDAVEQITAACAHLPLALAITAARAATHPHFSLGTVAAELADARNRLDALADTDPATDVRAVFSWSYRTLDPAAARMFRLLGLHPGPAAGVDAVASLTALPPARVRPLLAQLIQANLLVEQPPGRYGFHDLLHTYAKELAGKHEAEPDRAAAVRRALDFYLHTALTADQLLFPHRSPVGQDPEPPAPGTATRPLEDIEAAQVWFAGEEQNLRAAIDLAAAEGLDTHSWFLPWSLGTWLDRQWKWREQLASYEVGLAAAQRAGNVPLEARSWYALGNTYVYLEVTDQAVIHLSRALELYVALGQLSDQARTHLNLGIAARREGRYQDALEQAGRGLELYRVLGDRAGEASALNNLGWCQVSLGDYVRALEQCRRAVTIHEEEDNRYGAAHSWDSVGYAHHHLGEYPEAIACYERSLEMWRELGDRPLEAIILDHLGDSHRAAGSAGKARDAWRRALDIFTEIDHPEAERVAAKLTGSRPPGPSS